MLVVTAIDPGDVHTGMAHWVDGRRRVETIDTADFRAVDRVRQLLEAVSHPPVRRVLVIERFSLYANKSTEQIGSQFETSQLIGQLKLVARDTDTEVVVQGADIKKGTKKQLRARGIDLVSAGSGGDVHAGDAELHLIHYLLKEQLWETN